MKRKVVIFALVLGLSACEDVTYRSSVPEMPVRYTLYISREYPNFIVENGFQTLPAITAPKFEGDFVGYAGLLVWVGMDNAYHAADVCCPNCLKRNTPVEVDGFYAVCPMCGEHFDLSYGLCVPTKGKTHEALKIYTTLYRNAATGAELRITN